MALPFITAIVLATGVFSKDCTIKRVALGVALVETAIAIGVSYLFYMYPGTMMSLSYPWIPLLGISFKVGIDGISILMLVLTTAVTGICILSSFKNELQSAKTFYALIMAMLGGLLGVFMALDGFLFYVYWELALLPAFLLLLGWGNVKKPRVPMQFLVYMIAGSFLLLAALIYIYFATPMPHVVDIKAIYHTVLSPDAQQWIFWALFIGFAIKTPLFPFHTWQPDTYQNASPTTTMLVAGLLSKMGLYGMYRWLIPIVPLALPVNAPWVIGLAIIGTVYAYSVALVQTDIKRLIAYTSIAHLGLIVAGIMTGTLHGLQGGMIQILSHGLTSVGLFLVAAIIFQNCRTHNLRQLGGLARSNPFFAAAFLMILLGSIAFPLTGGFIGEFLILWSLVNASLVWAGVAAVTIVLGAWVMLRFYHGAMLGPSTGATIAPLSRSQKAALALVIAGIFFIGLFPNIGLKISEPAVRMTQELALRR